jgi:hypothetical protein
MKIVSNIFYLTAFYTYKDLMKEWMKDSPNTPEMVDEIYQKHLKEIRQKVYQFFSIQDYEEIKAKYLVRLYPYILPSNNEVKERYVTQNNAINLLLDNLKVKIYPREFMNKDEYPTIQNVI